MIPSLAEINAALVGAFMLLKRNPDGMRCFDYSIDGFFRSFFALVLAAPAYLILKFDEYRTFYPSSSLSAYMVAESISYIASWLVFPLVAIVFLRFLDLGNRYVPLIVAGNWTAVLQMMIYLVAFALTAVFRGPDAAALFFLIATAVVIIYRFYVIRLSLDTTWYTALQILIVDLVVSLLAVRLIGALLPQGTQAG